MLDTSTALRWLVEHFQRACFFSLSLEYPVSGFASVSDFLMRHDAMVICFPTFF